MASKSTSIRPLALFRIRPKPDRPEYYQVRIFKTQEQMFRWSERRGFDVGGREANTGAYVCSFQLYHIDADGGEKTLPQIGIICLHLDELGAGVVSHEMTHAALYWFRYSLGDYSQLEQGDYLETVCQVQGDLTGQFWDRYFRLVRQGRLPE